MKTVITFPWKKGIPEKAGEYWLVRTSDNCIWKDYLYKVVIDTGEEIIESYRWKKDSEYEGLFFTSDECYYDGYCSEEDIIKEFINE
jgi:hypothetical protein